MFIGHLDILFVKSLIMSFAFVKLGSFLFPLICYIFGKQVPSQLHALQISSPTL